VTIEGIRDFSRRLQRASAERVVPTAHGVGLFADSVPSVYDANYLSVEDAAATGAKLADEADAVMESSFHRRVILEQGDDLASAALAAHGYLLSSHLVLVHAREPDRRVDTSMIREVAFEQIVAARTAAIEAEPWGDAEIARQLNDAKRLIMRAVPTRFLIAVADGEIAAYCEVRSDGRIAQIEDVEVLPSYRGRGLGRAIVQHALDVARDGNEVVFLEALADDWPRYLYSRLGFDVAGRRDFLTVFPHPLTRLRLRTPRLELRLTTVAELRQLYEVAAAGIHDADFMPFGVAWTDDLAEEEFVAFHRALLSDARPDEWELALVVFFEGVPVGVQSIHGRGFGERRAAGTGSWLGRPWQGRGFGTEMRTAALVFAFDCLGAEVATSGAIDGNAASLGVSGKLGYEQVSVSTASPRGVPVEHADLELPRARFHPAVPVEVAGFEPALLPWFGAAT
jgi:RimJ/RimL family protein N-acetyltransferase/predicted GNAT family acetyltransferase